ncbi:flippase [Flammeovirgaceae bacterium 311]|nr:flippase [Flammeovirgaceae bacterium 311]
MFKAAGLFGGVQVIQILTVLVRSKFIAILLGPAGMGVSSLFLSTTAMIGNIAGLGLNFSAVRDISQAAETNDISKVSRILKIISRWIWVSGLIGMISTLAFAPYLSQFAFGNKDYTWAFVWLSVTLLLNALSSGNIALMQGMHKLKSVAKSSVIGSVVGLTTSVPLYYFYGIKGIVPALILASLSAFIISFFLARKIEKVPVKVSYSETYREGQEMVKLGVIMMISVFIGTFVTYIVNAFISHKGGIEDVGLYQAGISITNQYVGLVFGAMSVDYFPRLSAISVDNKKVRELANQQGEIVLLIAAPLLVALIVTAPLVIRILLSPEFYSITKFIRFIAVGMLFKAASFAVGYISFAKGDKKVFFIVEGVIGNFMTLLLNVVAYSFWGLNGLGISFLLSYVLYFILILGVTKRLYSFTLEMRFIKLFQIFLLLCLISFVVMVSIDTTWSYVLGGLIFLISVIISYREMEKRIDLKSFINSRFNRPR